MFHVPIFYPSAYYKPEAGYYAGVHGSVQRRLPQLHINYSIIFCLTIFCIDHSDSIRER